MKFIFLMALFVLTAHVYGRNFEKPKFTVISGKSALLKDGDTVTMDIAKYGNFYVDQNLHESHTAIVENSRYRFSFSISIPVYIVISKPQVGSKYNLILYLVEPGANVLLNSLDDDNIQFTGKGAESLRVQFENRKIFSKWLKKGTDWDTLGIIRTFALLDSCSAEQVEYLTSNKESLGARAYNILVADVLGESGLKIENRLIRYTPSPYFTLWRRTLLSYKNQFWDKYNKFDPYNKFVKYSYHYAYALIAKYKWDSCVVLEKPFSLKKCYDYFKFNLQGTLREKVITTLLYDNKSNTEDVSYCLITALDFTSDPDFTRLLQKMKQNLATGSHAYRFKLPDESGKIHDFSEYEGKVLLLDFWFTGCVACIKVKPKIDSLFELFASQEVVLISISVDKDRQSWLNSVRKNIYTSKLNINLFTEGKAFQHPIISHYLVRAYPTFLIIDKKGKLFDHPINPLIDNGQSFVELVNKALK